MGLCLYKASNALWNIMWRQNHMESENKLILYTYIFIIPAKFYVDKENFYPGRLGTIIFIFS